MFQKSKGSTDTALPELPSLLTVFGYAYYFGGFLVGPQFSMHRYQQLVNGDFNDKVSGTIPDR